jgi:serine acetyltransferase
MVMNKVHPSSIVSTKVQLHRSVTIDEFSVIGKRSSFLKKRLSAIVREQCKIGSHAVVYEGAILSRGVQVEDYCRIGECAVIGAYSRIIYGAKIYSCVTIGKKSIIGGFICEDVEIGDCCRIFGKLVHQHKIPSKEFKDMDKWDEGGEDAPKIGNNVFVGFGALLIGGISLGDNCSIWPGAIVTKDVPRGAVVKGINGGL